MNLNTAIGGTGKLWWHRLLIY